LNRLKLEVATDRVSEGSASNCQPMLCKNPEGLRYQIRIYSGHRVKK